MLFSLNLAYYFGTREEHINVFKGSGETGTLVTTAILCLYIASVFWEEIYKKFLYIKISSNGKVIIFRFFRKYVLEPDMIRSVRIVKLFTRGALPNEVIRIETADTKFIISKLYMANYNVIKNYLSL